MIVANRLTKQFGRIRAVDGIDFEIPSGQVVGFLGPNGAGKTTTIRMIAGFLPPTSGCVRVDGLDVAMHSRDVRRRIGYLPEAAPLYTEMRVAEYLRFRAKLFGIERGRMRSAIDLALSRCAIDDVRKRPINQLSKGYRQRVGLAAAILHQPPVLILDEPTVGLDPTQIRQIRALIRSLVTDGGHTILLSTHILPEVELTCDRVLMIARGRIQASGTLDELRTRAAGSSRYILEVDNAAAESAFRTVPGVAAVESMVLDGKWRRISITADGDSNDLREALAGAAAKAGATARELRREAPSLEQLFIQTAAHAEAPA